MRTPFWFTQFFLINFRQQKIFCLHAWSLLLLLLEQPSQMEFLRIELVLSSIILDKETTFLAMEEEIKHIVHANHISSQQKTRHCQRISFNEMISTHCVSSKENQNLYEQKNSFVYILKAAEITCPFRTHISNFIILESTNLHNKHQKRIYDRLVESWCKKRSPRKFWLIIFCYQRDMSDVTALHTCIKFQYFLSFFKMFSSNGSREKIFIFSLKSD